MLGRSALGSFAMIVLRVTLGSFCDVPTSVAIATFLTPLDYLRNDGFCRRRDRDFISRRERLLSQRQLLSTTRDFYRRHARLLHRAQDSSLASIVIVVFNSREIGHPAFAFAAAVSIAS